MGDLLGACNNADLIKRSDLRAQSAVHTKHLAVHDSSKRQKVEDLAAGLPHRGIAVFRLTLLVKAVDLGDLPRLMVASDQGYPIGISASDLSDGAGRMLHHASTYLAFKHISNVNVSRLK